MKKIFYIILLVSYFSFGQTTTNNYIETVTYTQESQNSNQDPSVSQRQITYFDGLGRPSQQIAPYASPNGNAIVTCFEYDGFGRQAKENLSFTATSSSLNFNPTALMSLGAFYNVSEYENTLNPFSEKMMEASSLGRIVELGAPGEDWKIGKNTIRYNYLFNQAKDKIRKFSVTHPSNDTEQTSLAYNGYYPINSLYKTITKDENWAGSSHGGYYQVEWNYQDFVNSSSTSGENVIMTINNNMLSLKLNISGYPYSLLKTGVVKVLDINIDDVNLGNLSYDGIDVYNVYIQDNKLYFTKIYTGSALIEAYYDQTLTAVVNVLGISKGHTTEEYKDKMGRIILKRSFESEIPHDTYYVYDKFSNLSYVIPPLASEQIVGSDFSAIIPVWRNFPWTKLTQIDPVLAVDYENAISAYDNGDILNVDYQSQYGGKGGFSIVTDDENNLMLNLNVTTSNPLFYNTGIIADLTQFGNFSNQEIGRIDGPDYEYIFLITGNNLEVVGSGKVPSINRVFNTGQKLDYSKNYPWSSLCSADQRVIDAYENDIKTLHNSQLLTTYTPNDYGASGGVSVNLDSNDNISVSLNISTQTEMELKSGALFSLDIQRSLPDMDLGIAEGNGYKYEFWIINNSLTVRGAGKFSNLTFFGNRGPLVSSSVKNQVVDGLCYIYHYDKKNRVIEKHIPDNGWTHIVYDKMDRPVFTQDSNLRTKQYSNNNWLFTKYDVFSRILYTGELASELNRKQLQNNLDNAIGAPLNETRSGSPMLKNGLLVEYTNNVFGNIAGIDLSTFNLHTVTYYDNYQFQGGVRPEIVENVETVDNPTGLPTGTFTRTLGTDLWTKGVTAYNDKSQIIYTLVDDSFLGSTNSVSNLLDFTGKILKSSTIHTKTGQPGITIVDEYSYDNNLRLLKHIQQIENQEKELIVWNKYDALGKLEVKKVGGINTSAYLTAGLQKIDYGYNIRGWLKDINNGQISENDLFGFKILYNNNGSYSLYNGNISETQWISINDHTNRSYKYSYDELNRLVNAEPYQDNISSHSKFWEGGIQYDKNGNIKKLSRTGLVSNITFGLIDDLSYIYKPYSNELLRVSDAGGVIAGFSDINIANTNDYDYDANGNLKKDMNKKIGVYEPTTYNYLNLPEKISVDADNYIKYYYNAAGVKQQKLVKSEGLVKTTQYAGGFVYQDNLIQYFPNEEGYVNKGQDGSFSYIYQYKDHLGNVRLSYADADGDGAINDVAKFSDGFEEENNWNADWYGYESFHTPLSIDKVKPAHSGNSCAKLTSPQSGYSHSNVTLEVNNTVATEYIYSGWFYSDGPQVAMYLFMNKEDETFYYTDLDRILGTTTGTGKWQYLEKRFMVQPYIDKINLRLDILSTGTIWFDDVSIRKANGASEIIEETEYYPFGMQHKHVDDVVTSTNIAQKIKYQGQERQDELGLNWDSFKYRNYDYAIGRFFNVDPLAEKYAYQSPYNFSENKVIDHRELEGLEGVSVHNDLVITAEEIGNSIKQGVTNVINWFENLGGKPEKSTENVSVSLRSKNGGGNNPTTTGTADDHWNVDGFIDGAPGGEKNGNKYKSFKDYATFGKDVVSGVRKSGKATEKVMNEISKNESDEKPTNTVIVVSYNEKNGGLVKSSTTVGKPTTESQSKKDSTAAAGKNKIVIIQRP